MNIQKNGMMRMNKLLNIERKYNKMYKGNKSHYFTTHLLNKLI